MAIESNFEALFEAMTQANPEHNRDFTLSVIEAMSDSEKHHLKKLQDSVLPAEQVQILERRIREGFDAFGEAALLSNHHDAVGEAFRIAADVAKRLANSNS